MYHARVRGQGSISLNGNSTTSSRTDNYPFRQLATLSATQASGYKFDFFQIGDAIINISPLSFLTMLLCTIECMFIPA